MKEEPKLLNASRASIKQGDSRNVSRPLGRIPTRWSKVKLVFKALQIDGGKSLLTPVGDL